MRSAVVVPDGVSGRSAVVWSASFSRIGTWRSRRACTPDSVLRVMMRRAAWSSIATAG